ncbi:MAG: coenzyme F420-0:L-glutamate ligase [Chloroflexi bacterium]|nr:coenzyme F420-0:L-glutamate ligase [Chloroflexota bacterium]|tara:strand:- start:523 stop:1287 length:765 start_codon:yes stop_codon:yes gene_type:complete
MNDKRKKEITIFGISGIPEIEPGFDLGNIISKFLVGNFRPLNGDIIVIAQKIISKSENCISDISLIEPSREALRISKITDKDPKLVQLILNNSREIIRASKGVLIVETTYGYICANAGVDSSNMNQENLYSFLPSNPDESAYKIRETVKKNFNVNVGVIISDTFNRPWRIGSINVALGFSGFDPLLNLIGEKDDFGNILKSTLVNVADEIASSAQLVMGESSRVPVALVRGYGFKESNLKGYDLFRDKDKDLFR